MAWITRYTSLRPEDIDQMTPWEMDIFADELEKILSKEKGAGL